MPLDNEIDKWIEGWKWKTYKIECRVIEKNICKLILEKID